MIFWAIYWFLASFWTLGVWAANRAVLRRTAPADAVRRAWPRVSVLVPARNEEKRIAPLLEGLASQDYPSYEVLALDDESTDGTLGLMKGFARSRRNFRVLEGKPLPPYWRGKPWACHQLARSARGTWLLFVDADTWHTKDMLRRAVNEVERLDADILTLLTRQETRSVLEALVVPVMVYNFMATLPLVWALDRNRRASRWAGVSGQFILARAKAYRAFGGHEAVKNEIVEDLCLGRRAVASGCRVAFADGSDIASARMYTNAAEVWEGFTKNYYPAAGFSLPRFLFIQAVFLLNGVLPFAVAGLFLAGCPMPGLLSASALLFSAVQVFIRLMHALDHGFTPWSAPFHPLGVLMFALMGFHSFWLYVFGGGGRWKGRRLQNS